VPGLAEKDDDAFTSAIVSHPVEAVWVTIIAMYKSKIGTPPVTGNHRRERNR
jgi:hypothetical protein